jgi:hypothetical protein
MSVGFLALPAAVTALSQLDCGSLLRCKVARDVKSANAAANQRS